MNTSSNRDFAAICVIVLAVCIGGWMMLVEPMATRLGRLEAAIADEESKRSLFTEQTVTRMADQMQDVRRRIAEVNSRNTLANDSASLYSTVRRMAADHGVELRSHNVGSARAGTDGGSASVTLHLEVSGAYVNVATFLQNVLELDGFLRPDSIALTPALSDDGEFRVNAVLSCEAMRFSIPEALASMEAHAGDS